MRQKPQKASLRSLWQTFRHGALPVGQQVLQAIAEGRISPLAQNSDDKATKASLMLRIIILAVALLIDPAIIAGAEMSGCSQLPDLSAARHRWAAVRKSPVDAAHNVESCRSYGRNFFEAVTTRQAASFCTEGLDRERTLELLDSEINAFNDLIATQCNHGI